MTQDSPKLLIVDNDQSFLDSIGRTLSANYSILFASDAASARQRFSDDEPDVVLLDLRLRGDFDKDGMILLKELLSIRPGIPVLMISAYGDMESVVECMRIGAVDFIQKPPNLSELRNRLNAAFEREKVVKKAIQMENRLNTLEPGELIGNSLKIRKITDLIKVVAQDGQITALIKGESGTGKELVARAIHRCGRRSSAPYVIVNTPAIPSHLMESELFGHEKGAFTGAVSRRIGMIEDAGGGVLFIDEVGEIPLEVQAKLLRFLQERTFTRLGSNKEIKIDVQIVTATNKDLEKAVKERTFREDLYHRLNVLQLIVPPLRDRIEDVPVLAEYFLELFYKQGRTKSTKISKEASDVIKRYSWPGNVRELKNAIERAILFANFHGHDSIELDDLPQEVLDPKAYTSSQITIGENGINLDYNLARLELGYIDKALSLAQGRKSEAWKMLGLNDRFALLRRVKSLLEKYPDLKNEFPVINIHYGKE